MMGAAVRITTKKTMTKLIEDFTLSINLDPNNADYYDWRGSAYHEKEDYDKAIEDFTQAINLDPNH